jgi:hypothetical protein
MKVVQRRSQLSILDGWWTRCTTRGRLGYPSAETGDDIEQRNASNRRASTASSSARSCRLLPAGRRRAQRRVAPWVSGRSKLSPQVGHPHAARGVEQLYEPPRPTPSAWGATTWPHPLARAVGPPPDRAWPSVAVAATAVDRLPAMPAGSPSPPRSCSATSTRPTRTCRPSTAIDLDYDLLEPSTSMDLTGDGDHPGWRRYQLPIVMPGRQLASPSASCPPRRRRATQVGRGLAPSSGAH